MQVARVAVTVQVISLNISSGQSSCARQQYVVVVIVLVVEVAAIAAVEAEVATVAKVLVGVVYWLLNVPTHSVSQRRIYSELAISFSHSILTRSQPVPGLILTRQAPVRGATAVPMFKALVRLIPVKGPRGEQGSFTGLPPLRPTPDC